MKISVLYFAGCPNHAPSVELARRLVAELGLDAEIEQVEVASPDDAERLRFLGSPTVQVNGVDIEPAARTRTDFAMSCRLYATPDARPSRAMLLAALGCDGDARPSSASGASTQAQHGGCCERLPAQSAASRGVRLKGDRVAKLTAVGSVVTATLSSACCWVPLLLLAVGASAAGVSAILGPWRPAFIGAAVAMLGLGFYFAFIRRPVAGAECCTPDRAKGRRWQRITWCVSAVMVTAFVLFPHWGGRLVDASSAAEASAPPFQVRELVFQIDGMHCQACAAALTAELSKIEGVQGVNVDYATKTARLFASSQSAVARVQESAQRLGYRASARTPRP